MKRASADALYEEAGKLMDHQRFAEACPKLESSEELDPAIGTLIRLGYCYANTGRTASALRAFQAARSMALNSHDRRAGDAVKAIRSLEPVLSMLVVEVEPSNRVAGVEVRRDGAALDAGL